MSWSLITFCMPSPTWASASASISMSCPGFGSSGTDWDSWGVSGSPNSASKEKSSSTLTRRFLPLLSAKLHRKLRCTAVSSVTGSPVGMRLRSSSEWGGRALMGVKMRDPPLSTPVSG